MALLLLKRFLLGLLSALVLCGCLQSSIEEMAVEQAGAAGLIPQGAVADLSEESLADLMTEVLLRFRSYSELRERLTLESLVSPESPCREELSSEVGDTHFTVLLPCMLEPAENGDAWEGQVEVAFDDSGGRLEIYITYIDVRLGDVFSLDGVETLFDDSLSGATGIALDMTQNGLNFSYSFKVEQFELDQVLITYEMDTPAGILMVMLFNPTSVGAFASAVVAGIDGSLLCEIRNADWAPGQAAKGTCEDGSVFGL